MRTMLRLTGEEEFSFEIATAAYQRYVVTRGSRWPEQERLGRAPAFQHVGASTAETMLDGVIYPGVYGSVQEGVKKLRRLSLAEKPFQMVTGKGEVCGFWAVTEVSDTRSFFLDDGQARKIEFSLKLKYYGSDYQGSAGNVGQLSDAAARVDVPAVVAAPSQELGGLPDIGSDAALAEVTSFADAAGAVVRGASDLAQDVLRSVGTIQNLAGMAANHALPAEYLNGIREVTRAARAVLDVGDRIFETVSAVAALPYTLTDASRLGDIAFTLRENLLYTRDTARLTGYGMDGVQRGLAATGRTLERLPDRSGAAEHCLSVSEQAGLVDSLCRSLDQDCSALLEKFR